MRRCVVPFCDSNSSKDSVSFHEFPSDIELRELWIRAVCREGEEKGTLWIPKEHHLVCGKHFLPSDFKVTMKKKKLNTDAIPSVFPFYPKYFTSRKLVLRQKEIIELLNKKTCSNSVQFPDLSTNTTLENQNKNYSLAADEHDEIHEADMPIIETSTDNILRKVSNTLGNQNIDFSLTSDDVEFHGTNMPKIETSTDNFLRKISKLNCDVKFLKTKIRKCTNYLGKTKKRLSNVRLARRKLYIENKDLKKVIGERYKLSVIEQEANEGHPDAVFLLDQINFRQYKTFHWSPSTIQWCALWFRNSPSGYRYVRNSGMVKLPNLSTLKRYKGYIPTDAESANVLFENKSQTKKKIGSSLFNEISFKTVGSCKKTKYTNIGTPIQIISTSGSDPLSNRLESTNNENEIEVKKRSFNNIQKEAENYSPFLEEEGNEHKQQSFLKNGLEKADGETMNTYNNDKLKFFIFSDSSKSSNSNKTDCVTHEEALKAVETLLRYMENQDDTDNADLILIGSYQKRILENIKKEQNFTNS